MSNQMKTLLLGLLLLFTLAAGIPAAAHAQPIVQPSTATTFTPAGAPVTMAPAPAAFTYTQDAVVQENELAAYLAANNLAARVVQVDLGQYPKVSQYTDINASADAYGPNACGLVAAAVAVGGSQWSALVSQIAQAAGSDYGVYTGIQPSKYVAALGTVFGSNNVVPKNTMTLGALYQELQAGNIVIVDIKVNAVQVVPSADGETYAHFARVLGIDAARRQVHIENTLQGGSY